MLHPVGLARAPTSGEGEKPECSTCNTGGSPSRILKSWKVRGSLNLNLRCADKHALLNCTMDNATKNVVPNAEHKNKNKKQTDKVSINSWVPTPDEFDMFTLDETDLVLPSLPALSESLTDSIPPHLEDDAPFYGRPLSTLVPYSLDSFDYDPTTLTTEERVKLVLDGPLLSTVLSYLALAGDRPPTPCFFTSIQEAVREYKSGKCIGAYFLELPPSECGKLLSAIRISGSSPRGRNVISRNPVSTHSRNGVKLPSDYVHILYAKGYSRIPKPSTYSLNTYRAWVHGESSHIWETSARYVPTLSNSSLALYRGCGANTKYLSLMLGQATVTPTMWSEIKSCNSSSDVLHRILYVGPFTFSKFSDLESLADIFSKHKPFMRMAKRFYEGDPSVIPSVLTDTMEKVLVPGLWDEVSCKLAGNSGERIESAEEFSYDETCFPELVSRQGSVQSGTRVVASTLHDEDHMKTLGRDFGEGVAAGMTSAFPQASHSILKSLANAVLGITQMALADSPLTFALAMSQTLLNDPIAYAYASNALESVIKRQGLEDGVTDSDETQWYANIMAVGIFSSLKEFFGDVYQALFPSFLSVCGGIKFASVKMLSQNVATWIADGLYELSLRLKACWKQRSISPLWGVDGPRWCRHSYGVLSYWEHIVSTGDNKLLLQLQTRDELPIGFHVHMTHAEFCVVLREHIQHGENILSVIAAPRLLDMNNVLARLRALVTVVEQMTNNSASRVKPFCILFYSKPGTGKTTQADKIARAWAAEAGRATSDIYYFAAENFRSTFRSSTAVVRMDDPDAGVAPPSAGFQDHCQFIQGLASSQPFPIEQAGVEEKGKHFARPMSIIITTNHYHLQATRYSAAPSAVWRRMEYYIESVVKDEYSDRGRIDVSATVPSDSACVYNVSKFDHAGETGNTLHLKLIARGMEWDALCRFLQQEKNAHLARQEIMLAPASSRCSECFFESCICVIAQGVGMSRPRDFMDASELVEHLRPVLPREAHNNFVRDLLPRLDSLMHPCEADNPLMKDDPVCRTLAQGLYWDETESSEIYYHRVEEVVPLMAKRIQTKSIITEPLSRIQQYFSETSGMGLIAATTAAVATIGLLVTFFKVVQQGRPSGTSVDSWFRTSTIVTPAFPEAAPCTWTQDELKEIVRRNLVEVCGVGAKAQTVQGVVYKPGWVVFPSHCFGTEGLATFSISGRKAKVRREHTYTLYNAELSVVYISDFTSFNGTVKHWVPFPVNSNTLGDAALVGKHEYSFGTVKADTMCGFPTWAYAPLTVDGDCGSCLVAKGPGDASRIFGVHIWKAATWSSSVQVSADQIDAVIARQCSLSATVQGAAAERVLFEGNFKHEVPELKHYPPMSEIGVATTHYECNALCYGTFPSVGRKMKTAFKRTTFYDAVYEHCLERGIHCDFSPPEFRGGMIEDKTKYFSPFIHALRDTNMSETTYEDVVDFLVDRIKGHYGGILSEADAIKGVPGVINSINRKSSMGGPIYGPKSLHITEDREEISPELCAGIDELESILDQGKIPRIVAEAMLKDEVLKVGKNARVFCMLPAAFNIVCKRRFAILKVAMRSSYIGSGCAVGIDMGSRSVEDVVEFLRHYEHKYALDVSRMDKCWTPQAWDAVALYIYRLTAFSVGHDEAWKAWALVMSMKEAIINLKGDYFSIFWNISGNDITVELNSILLMLMLTKAAKIKGLEIFPITYGDDNISCFHEKLPADFFQFLQTLTGFVFTDDKKNSTPHAAPLTELSFLKREFRYDAEYQVWTAPLALSSIAKMLMFRGKSSLSPTDHEQDLVSAAVRYLPLHGRRVYEDWLAMLRPFLLDNPPGYDDAMKAYVGFRYSDWTAREAVHDGTPSLSAKWQGLSTDMTVTTTDAMANAPLSLTSPEEFTPTVTTDESTVADSVFVHPIGDHVQDATVTRFSRVGVPPSFSLDSFLERWTPIAEATVASTDTVMQLYGTINVVEELLSNGPVADKLRHYSFFNGDIEVMGVWNVPGNASGVYAVCLQPRLQSPWGTNGTFYAQNILSYEHSLLLPVSEGCDFTLQAPFFSRFDMENTDPDELAYTWMLRLVCLSPIRTAIPGGVDVGHLKLYARFKPGYQLSVPKWQGLPSTISWQGKKTRTERSLMEKLQEDRIISRGAGLVSGLSTLLVPVLGPAAASVAATAGTISALADSFGFSRTNVQSTPTTVVNRSVTNVANVDATDNTDVCGFSCENKISISPLLVGAPDEDIMAFESMSNRWVVVDSFTWSSSDEGVLSNIPVTPGYGHNDSVGLDMSPTGAGYCGLPFEYWRADAEYLVVIPGSNLHRGAIQALYVPFGVSPGSVDAVTNTSLNAIMELEGCTNYHLKVSFAQKEPMKHLAYFRKSTPIIPAGSTNGSIQFRVVNPLVSQNPVDTLNITVFARFRNVQFAVPRTTLTFGGFSNHWEDAVTLQGEESPSEDIVVDLVPGSGAEYPVSLVVAGETVNSLRAIAQRPTRIFPRHETVEKTNFMYFAEAATRMETGSFPRTTATQVATLPFVSSAYSERIRVMSNTFAWIGAGHVSGRAADRGKIFSHFPMTASGAQVGSEFTIPYYQRFRSGVSKGGTAAIPDLFSAGYERLSCVTTTGVQSPVRAEVYYSSGDDIRVGPYRGVPRLGFKSETVAPLPWMVAPSP